MNVILGYACPEDAEAVGRLHYTCRQETYRGLLPDSCLDGMSAEKTAPFNEIRYITDIER